MNTSARVHHLHRWLPWALVVLGIALVATSVIIQHSPAFLEMELARLAGRSPQSEWRGVLLGTMLLGTAALAVAYWVRTAQSGESWFDEGVAILQLGLAILLALLACIASHLTSPTAMALDDAAIALSGVRVAEAGLGHPTPVGNRLRDSMESLATLEANRAFVNQVIGYDPDAKQVWDVLAAASIVGPGHPVVRFVSENGMVRPGDRQRLYRDVVNRVARNKVAASDPAVVGLLARLTP